MPDRAAFANVALDEGEEAARSGSTVADSSGQDAVSRTVSMGENEGIIKNGITIPDIKRDTSGITTQYMAAGIVNLGSFAAGVCLSWSSSALALLQTLTPYEASWVASLLNLGAVFGAVPTGLISEYFGRKKTLLYLALPLLVSWILVASSPNVYGLYVGRFVSGVAVGAFSVAIPPYVSDVSEPGMRASCANFYHVMFAGGMLFGYIIGMVRNASVLAVLCASLPVAYFIAFLFLPESPVYLMSQGKSNEAKAALQYFRGIDNSIDEEMATVKDYIRNAFKNKATFNDLFSTRSTIKALVVCFGLMIFQQLSGIYPVIFYAESIFSEFKVSISYSGAAIILGFCLVTSTYFSTMLLKKCSRRILLMISFISMAVSVGSLGIYFHLMAPHPTSTTWIPLLALCIFVSMYAIGVGPIPWLMLRDIFPPNITRRATAFTAGFHWLLAFGVTKFYMNLVTEVRIGWVLWDFAVASIIGALFVYFFVPETKGRDLQEIQNEFDGVRNKRRHRHIIEVVSEDAS